MNQHLLASSIVFEHLGANRNKGGHLSKRAQEKTFDINEKSFWGIRSIGYPFWYNMAIKSEASKPTQIKIWVATYPQIKE